MPSLEWKWHYKFAIAWEWKWIDLLLKGWVFIGFLKAWGRRNEWPGLKSLREAKIHSKGSTWIVLVLSQSGGDTCHKVSGWREGQRGVNKGGSKLITLQINACKSNEWALRGFEDFGEAINALWLRYLEGKTLLWFRKVLSLVRIAQRFKGRIRIRLGQRKGLGWVKRVDLRRF